METDVLNNLHGRQNLVVLDGDYVLFRTPNSWDYEIPVADLTSQYWIAEWVGHMAEKTWVSKDHLRIFASIIQTINKRGEP